MSEMNENNEQKMGNTIDKDAVMNLANNLIKNENSIDINSIMRMATNLLKDDSLMNSVKDLGKVKKIPTLKVPKVPDNQEKTALALIHEQLEKIANDLLEVKRELTNLTEQNKNLLTLIQTASKDQERKSD